VHEYSVYRVERVSFRAQDDNARDYVTD
jgi:hypothetical protein